MKVSELTGEMLDYWVAKPRYRYTRIAVGEHSKTCETRDDDRWPWYRFMPSRTWIDGGPIIELEGIGIVKFYEAVDGRIPEDQEWGALSRDDKFKGYGPTPLVAAMRAYVASRYGDEVPEE